MLTYWQRDHDAGQRQSRVRLRAQGILHNDITQNEGFSQLLGLRPELDVFTIENEIPLFLFLLLLPLFCNGPGRVRAQATGRTSHCGIRDGHPMRLVVGGKLRVSLDEFFVRLSLDSGVRGWGRRWVYMGLPSVTPFAERVLMSKGSVLPCSCNIPFPVLSIIYTICSRAESACPG